MNILTLKAASSAVDSKKTNRFLDEILRQLEEDLETSGCLPSGPDQERVRIHGEAWGMITDHMGQFKDIMSKVKQMYDGAVGHYEREVAPNP